jgi:ribosome-binding factor A
MSNRIEKLESLFTTEISNYWRKFQSDNIITVSKVDISRDLKNATIWVSTIVKTGSTIAELRKDIGNLSRHLSTRLSIRSMPHIDIKVDSGIAYADRISTIIEDLKNK